MCDMTNGCECEQVTEAYSGKGVEFCNPDTDQEFYSEGRLSVSVCVECHAPDWRTIC